MRGGHTNLSLMVADGFQNGLEVGKICSLGMQTHYITKTNRTQFEVGRLEVNKVPQICTESIEAVSSAGTWQSWSHFVPGLYFQDTIRKLTEIAELAKGCDY